MPVPKNKEKNRLYEPIAIDKNKSTPFTGILKRLVEEEERKFENGKINLIDYENLRKKAKEIENSTK
jgi:hypothetical protein|nr:MAG TPA: hypothetical protein [Caudoviricetes sp.]